MQINRTPYPKLKDFKIGHLNVASLYKHVDELRTFMNNKKFDILSINETRLDGTILTTTKLISQVMISFEKTEIEMVGCRNLYTKRYSLHYLQSLTFKYSRSCLY